MSGKRLLDLVAVFNASRGVVQKSIALRRQQLDVYARTSSLAKAVRHQTDRFTETARAASILAGRLNETGPTWASAAYSTASSERRRDSIPSVDSTGKGVGKDVRKAGIAQDHFYDRSEGIIGEDPVPESDLEVKQEKASRHPLPDGSIPPVESTINQPKINDETVSTRVKEPRKEALDDEIQGSALSPTTSGRSTIPLPSKTSSDRASDHARKIQRESEQQIPSNPVDSPGGQSKNKLLLGHDEDSFYDRASNSAPALSSLPRTKIPKQTGNIQESDLHVRDAGINSDSYSFPGPEANALGVDAEMAPAEEEVPEGVNTDLFNSPRVARMLSGKSKASVEDKSTVARPSTSIHNERPPSLNTSSNDPNAMPGRVHTKASMEDRSAITDPLTSLHNETAPSLNTSSDDPNAMPGQVHVKNSPNDESTSTKSSMSSRHETPPSTNTSASEPNAMPDQVPAKTPPADEVTITSSTASPRNETPPSMNTSSNDPNAMPGRAHTHVGSKVDDAEFGKTQQIASDNQPSSIDETPSSRNPDAVKPKEEKESVIDLAEALREKANPSRSPARETIAPLTGGTDAYQMRESSVPSSRFGRLWNYGGLAAGMFGGAVSEGFKRATGSGGEGSFMLSAGNMDRLVAKLSRMRGAALKLGQMMSFQDSKMLPAPIQQVLMRVQDSADYMPAYQRDRVLAADLGANWRELFSSFEEKPIAAASIGQVHRAVLESNGQKVAVKIQYPGVANSIDSDLSNLAVLLTASRLLPKGLYLDKTIANARTELAWECDYVREAECGRRFANLLADEKDVFLVPEIFAEASGKRVLTMKYMEGVGVTKVQNFTQAQRDWIGTQILHLCLREITEFKFMQTDPNWTNFLYNAGTNKLELLDFGASREYPEEFITQYTKVLVAASRSDRDGVRDYSVKLGYLTGHESKVMLNAHIASVMTLAEPFLESSPQVYDFRDQTITERVKALIPVMLRERLAPPPEETYSLHRKLSGAFLLCAKLGSRVPCRKLFRDAMSQDQLL